MRVLHGGEPVVRKGYGMADLERDTPITPEARFPLASVSKQFSAAAILLLVQDAGAAPAPGRGPPRFRTRQPLSLQHSSYVLLGLVVARASGQPE